MGRNGTTEIPHLIPRGLPDKIRGCNLKEFAMMFRHAVPTAVVAVLCAVHPGASGAGDLDARHVWVYHEAGRFGGWPANHGIWSWGDEILVGYSRGWYLDLGERHHIDRDKPEEHWLARSLDGGETWTLEHPAEKGQLIPQGDSLHGIETPGVHIPERTSCPGGIPFTHPDFAMTLRMSSVNAGVSRFYWSNDRGRNWQGPFRLPDFGFKGTAARTDYLVDGPDTCTALITVAKADGKEGVPCCIRTEDGGKTWELVSQVMPDPEGYAIMPATVRLSPAELYTVIRERDDTGSWLSAHRSLDNGKTWVQEKKPVDDCGTGNPGSLIVMKDGRLCLTYAVRSEPFRMCAKISADNGATWSPELVLRDDGASRDIGYSRTVQRNDGRIVTVYYFTVEADGPERGIAATIWSPPSP